MPNQQDPYASIMQKYNYTPPASSGQPVSSADDFNNFLNKQGSYAAPVPQQNVVQETGANYFGDNGVGGAAKDIIGGGNIGSAVKKFGKGDIAGGAEDATLGVASDAVKAIFAPISAPLQTLLAHVAAANAKNPNKIPGATMTDTPESEAARKQISEWAQAHPQLAKTFGDALTVGSAAIGSDGLNTPVSDVVSGVKDTVSNAINSTKEGVSDFVGGAKDTIAGVPKNDLETVAEMIQPKPTISQAKIAMDEGRLFEGNPATFLKEGTPSQIAASAQEANSARTIVKLIPDAAKMDGPTLYGALDEKVGEIATDLKPEMQAVEINPETVSNMEAQWEDVKTAQKGNAYTPSDVQVAKLQAEFEKRLESAKDGTLDDIWEARKAYDTSVPKNVRQANDLSSESLQAKKDIWLQNREIFSKAINDSENGLGPTSQKAFSDMRDMYEAQNGLLSKAKIVKEGAPSGLQQFGKTKTGKALKAGAKIFVGDKVLKSTTGIGL